MSLCGIGDTSVTMFSDRYDYFVPNVTDDYWFERTRSGGRGTSARCLDRCWASVVDGGPAFVRRWVGVQLLVKYALVHSLWRCPGTAPTWSRSWGFLGFTILCNNVTFWLSHSAYYIYLYYLHFGVTYKPKWAGYYCKHICIVIVICLYMSL